jgi:UDP-glucuronate 4-epimerase
VKRVLVTGAAGFIGFHTARRLLERGDRVVGIDNLNDYYAPSLKRDRLKRLEPFSEFSFEPLDVADSQAIDSLLAHHQFDGVIHLAAQAGVRDSIANPYAYVHSNLIGFSAILEGCRQRQVKHLVYASSSSVYGLETEMPFTERSAANHPVSLYAATKRSNELMAHSYSHLFGLPTTGLRFFTVYGPWGRPDMAPMLFANAISKREPIKVFNRGEMMRDFTFIDDIVDGVVRAFDRPPKPDPNWDATAADPGTSSAPYRIYNIGNNEPVQLMRFIELLEAELGICSEKIFMEMQPGDVVSTYADISSLQRDTGFEPTTSIEDGVRAFVAWFREYYATP